LKFDCWTQFDLKGVVLQVLLIQEIRQKMLTRLSVAKDEMLFRIPFGCVVPWKEYVHEYPLIRSTMDGSDVTSTLGFYYSRNPINRIYEFESEDAENDIAEMIGISFNIIANGESHEEEMARREKEKSNFEEPSVSKEQKEKQQRELWAFLHIEDEKERELFLSSTLTENEFMEYMKDLSATTTCSEPGDNGKRGRKSATDERKSAKKERRRQKVQARESTEHGQALPTEEKEKQTA
jgi:hypothetical protein